MNLLISLILNSLTLMVADYLVPGFGVENFQTALLAAIILGVINTFIKPLLLVLTAPINLLTLGLFTFVINAVILWLAAAIVPGLTISGPIPAILAAVVVSVISTILSTLVKDLNSSKKS